MVDFYHKLEKWDYIDRYSLWMFHIIQNYIGSNVFEIGAGMGRMANYYVNSAEKVVATDVSLEQVEYMKQKFASYDGFSARLFNVLEGDLSEYKELFDTVICINVLEHLSDDYQAVTNMTSLLKVGGYCILMAPAWEKLYCDLDKAVGHYRRYDPGRLRDIVRKNDLEIIKNHYFNMLGIIPYWIKGRNKTGKDESFSSSLTESNSKIYNLASSILEPIERRFIPKFGLTEVMIARKMNEN